jgi:hypothetical protein
MEQVLGMHASAHEALVCVLASTVEQVFRSRIEDQTRRQGTPNPGRPASAQRS